MKYNIKQFDDYVFVSGYDDGKDWIFRPLNQRIESFGRLGDDHIWFVSTREVVVFDMALRSHIYTFSLTGIDSKQSHCKVYKSENPDHLFVMVSVFGEPPTKTLYWLDAKRGREIKQFDLSTYQIERHASFSSKNIAQFALQDGTTDACKTHGILRLDLDTGKIETSLVEDRSGGAYRYFPNSGFENPSPNGKYWLLRHKNTLPVARVGKPGLFSLFRKEKYYGLSYQLWETWPLRPVRTIVVAWMNLEHAAPTMTVFDDVLPDIARKYKDGFHNQKESKCRAMQRTLFNCVAKVTALEKAGSLDCIDWPSHHQMFKPQKFLWHGAGSFWDHFFGYGPGHSVQWQPDSQAFWLITNRHFSRATIDGEISPRLLLARHGYAHRGTIFPRDGCGKDPRIVPHNDGSATISFQGGTALIRGNPTTSPYLVQQVPQTKDHWQASTIDEEKAEADVEALKSKDKEIVIQLKSLEAQDCADAIAQLTKILDDDFYNRAIDGEVRFVFKFGRKRLGEDKFFDHVRKHAPTALPDLRDLIEKYAQVGCSEIYWTTSPGSAALCHAARALGLMDCNSLPTLMRYSRVVDPEHESFFQEKIVPAVIKAHGWNMQTLRFAFHQMVQISQSSPDASEYWVKSGLRNAASKAMSPADFAQFVVDVIEEFDDDPLAEEPPYAVEVVGEIASKLSKSERTQWDEDFFSAFERIAARKQKKNGITWLE